MAGVLPGGRSHPGRGRAATDGLVGPYGPDTRLRGDAGQRQVERWLDRLGASGYADQSLGSMSKGMCQKMAIAQALLPSPGLLVLDEAWTGLDTAAREVLDDAVAERVADGGTVLFVDHDPARLAGRADERWQVGGDGTVTVAAGPGPVLRARRVERVTVRLETSDAGDVLEPGAGHGRGTGALGGRGRAARRLADGARTRPGGSEGAEVS